MMSGSDARWTVYLLVDPRNNDPRYVGITVELKKRTRAHINSAPHQETHKARWLKQLIAEKMKPVVVELEHGIGDRVGLEAEKRWVAHYRSVGAKLTNRTDGGEGCIGLRHTEESKAKMRAAFTGRKHKPESIKKMSLAQKGRKHSPDRKPLPPFTEEHRANIKKAHAEGKIQYVGHPKSEETRAKIAAKAVGRKHTLKARQKMSDDRRGKPQSPESNAKRSVAMTGKKRSPESIAKSVATRRANGTLGRNGRAGTVCHAGNSNETSTPRLADVLSDDCGRDPSARLGFPDSGRAAQHWSDGVDLLCDGPQARVDSPL